MVFIHIPFLTSESPSSLYSFQTLPIFPGWVQVLWSPWHLTLVLSSYLSEPMAPTVQTTEFSTWVFTPLCKFLLPYKTVTYSKAKECICTFRVSSTIVFFKLFWPWHTVKTTAQQQKNSTLYCNPEHTHTHRTETQIWYYLWCNLISYSSLHLL